MFAHIHEMTYELAALALKSEAKSLGHLLMAAAVESQRLARESDERCGSR